VIVNTVIENKDLL